MEKFEPWINNKHPGSATLLIGNELLPLRSLAGSRVFQILPKEKLYNADNRLYDQLIPAGSAAVDVAVAVGGDGEQQEDNCAGDAQDPQFPKSIKSIEINIEK